MSQIKENEVLCECTKCHKIFNFIERKQIKESGRSTIVSPCCEHEFRLYYDDRTENFLKGMASFRN